MNQAKFSETKPVPGTFIIFPLAAFDYLRERKLNITDLAVLCVLWKHRGNKTNMCNPSQTTIGDWINRSRSTVSKSINKLAQNRLVEIVAKSNCGEHRTNTYRVLFQPSKATNVTPITDVEFARIDRQDFIELSRKVGDELYKEKGV